MSSFFCNCLVARKIRLPIKGHELFEKSLCAIYAVVSIHCLDKAMTTVVFLIKLAEVSFHILFAASVTFVRFVRFSSVPEV